MRIPASPIGSITVVGVPVVGGGARTELSAPARAALAEADLLVGGQANLDLINPAVEVETIVLGPLAPALDRLCAHQRSGGHAVVVASGDPGFFGILRSLRAAGLSCQVLPAVGSVPATFAAAGLDWDGAVVVSAHGRELRPALNACRAQPRVAVLTGPGAGPVEIARGLAGWPRELLIAERLGLAGERITRAPAAEVAACQPSEFADPNVVLSLAPAAAPVAEPAAEAAAGPGLITRMRGDNQPAAAPESGWALADSEYEHRDSMITKAEVRAWVVARLRPSLGRLILDIGAGSGSVGIECALLGAAVIAVERDPEATAMIARNARRHGVHVRVVEALAPEAMADLPEADAAFVGGGGTAVVQDLARRRVRLVVAAFAALDRALAAHELLSAAGYGVEGVQLGASRLTGLSGGSLRLAATNPVLVLTGVLE